MGFSAPRRADGSLESSKEPGGAGKDRPPRVSPRFVQDDRAGQWSVRVSGNWRVVFRFEGGEAVDVDLIDYH